MSRLAYALLKRNSQLEETNIKKFHKEVLWKRIFAKQVKIKYDWGKYVVREDKLLNLRVASEHKAPFMNHHRPIVHFMKLEDVITILERSNEEFIWENYFPGFDHTERTEVANTLRRWILDNQEEQEEEQEEEVYRCGECHEDVPCVISFCTFHNIPNTIFSRQLKENCPRIVCTQCDQPFSLTSYDCRFHAENPRAAVYAIHEEKAEDCGKRKLDAYTVEIVDGSNPSYEERIVSLEEEISSLRDFKKKAKTLFADLEKRVAPLDAYFSLRTFQFSEK